MDINDPGSVAALLLQLQSSSAWQAATASTPPQSRTVSDSSTAGSALDSESFPTSHSADVSSSAPDSDKVASLLAQLQAAPLPPPESFRDTSPRQLDEPISRPASHHDQSFSYPSSFAPPAPEDRRNYSYPQALPVLSQLAEDPQFIRLIVELKKEQDDLEKRLWDERGDIRKKYEDKVKAAKTRARITGADLTAHEAHMLSDAYSKSVAQFDLERVLPLWDNLVYQQQQRMARAGVPTMYTTTESDERARQLRIIKILEDLSSQ